MNNEHIFDTLPLERVREGMAVLDESGMRLGTVKRVQMGEPGAVTTAGESGGAGTGGVAVAPADSSGTSTALGGAIPFVPAPSDEPDVPDPLRTRLRRVGFIEIDGSDLDGANRYVPGDRVADVAADTVRLGPSVIRSVGGSTEPTASAQSTRPTSAAGEPLLRSGLGTPRYVKSHSSRERPFLGLALGSASAVALGAASGAWLYRRRQQQARPDARLRRSLKSLAGNLPEDDRARLGGLGGGLLLTVILGTILGRARAAGGTTPLLTVPPPAMAGPRRTAILGQRYPGAGIGLALGALAVVVGVLRRRTRRQVPDYIGTPGVETAAGRDRSRTGELPSDYGIEHVRR